MSNQPKFRYRGGSVPFGYEMSETPGYVEPILRELVALGIAAKELENSSLREQAAWLETATGRSITHRGLKKRLERGIYLYGEHDG